MTISQHEHGPHDCYCPSCGYIESVEENIKCKTLACPQCGTRMRAVKTGEYRANEPSQIGQENPDLIESPGKTIIIAILTGIGLGIGLFIVSKIAKKVAK